MKKSTIKRRSKLLKQACPYMFDRAYKIINPYGLVCPRPKYSNGTWAIDVKVGFEKTEAVSCYDYMLENYEEAILALDISDLELEDASRPSFDLLLLLSKMYQSRRDAQKREQKNER